MQNKTNKEQELVVAFKAIIKEQPISSQEELVHQLVARGFSGISQSKVSRMLGKLGAVKIRNANDQIVYDLPEALNVPKIKHTIDTVVLNIKHNNYQIVLKTSIGGAPLLARMLDTMDESVNILGTLAGDDTVLIIPADTDKIDETTEKIRELLKISQS